MTGDNLRHRETILPGERTSGKRWRITELQDSSDVLKYKTWLYEVALEAGTDNMPLEEMPPNIRKIKDRIRRLTDDMDGTL